jgi:hypothetical protein
MVYDPAYNEQIADTYAEVFRDINDFLIELTAEAILEGKDYDGSIENWLQFKQTHLKRLVEQAEKAADDAFGAVIPAVEGAVEVAYSIGEQTAAAELLSAGIQTDVSGGFQTLAEYAIDGLVDSIANRFQNRVNKLDIVRSTNDIYAQVTESAAALVTSGAATLEEAVEIAVDKFLDEGIKSVNLGNRKMRLDAYAETSIRTISGNAQVQGSLDRYEDADQYLSWVSDSPMECEQCREWEGKILRTTNDLEKLPEKYRNLPSLDAAKADGLFHPNCTHSLQVYIEGYSTPPTDTNDAANEERRNKIRRLQRLERTNKLKEKIYKADGQTNRAKGARERAARYRKERRQFEAQIERKSLGWFTGEDRLRRLAEANGIKPEVLEAAKGNLPKLNKLAAKTGFDPRLVSTSVRKGVADTQLPDIKDFDVDNFDKLTIAEQKSLRLQYNKFFEGEFGIMNQLEVEGKYHNPPTLPDNVQKYNKSQFNKWIEKNGSKYTNEYGSWEWNTKKNKPNFIWNDKLDSDTWTPEIEQFLAEAEAAGALKDKKQVVAGGLPSSGKTFTLANKAKDPSLKTYQLEEYVTVNPDDFKTRIIFRDYASKTDKALDKLMSDTFINDDKFGVGSKLGATNPFMKKLKIHHPEIYDEVFGKTFDKSTLTEIREGIASKVAIGDTGLFGYEAANILHEESSAMTKKAQDLASDAGYNMIHDVTMGSAKPINLVDDLVNLKNYEPAEVMFIMYTEEQARATVVDRYIRGNFTNLNTTGGRGGRYVMSSVIDSSTKKVKTKAGFKSKTQDLLGRDAITDNEVFLTELLESENVTTNLDDIQIINRYSDIDPATGQAKAYRIELELKDGKIVAKRSSRGVDGLQVVTKEAETKFGGNRAGLDDLEEILEEQQLKSMQGDVTIGVKQSYLDEIAKRERYFKNLKRKYDDAGLYIVAKQKGYTGKPKVVKKATDLFEGDGLRNAPKDVTIKNGLLQDDVVVFRGLSDSMDTDQDTWTLQNTKLPAASRIQTIVKTTDFKLDDRIPHFETDSGFVFVSAVRASNTLQRKVNNLGMKFNSDYIDAETMIEAQEQWRAIKIKEGDGFYTKSYFTQSEEAVKKGFVDFGLTSNEDFQVIYDEILFTKGINVIEKPMPPLIMTGQQMHDEFINGDYYAGHGIYGRGTYTDINVEVAVMYANQSERVDGYGDGGVVQAMKLEKGTRMPSQETVSEVARQVELKRMEYYNRYIKGRPDEYKTRTYRELSKTTELDVGRTLAAMGYQAYDVRMLDEIKTHIVILDRTAVTVAEQPIMINGEYTR